MGNKNVLLAIAFVAVAMVSGGIVSIYGMDKASAEAKGTAQAEVHQHGLCGIDGCTQTGEHSHGICSIAGCTETEVHMHNDQYCYPHRADDGHAYHNCGVSGCTEEIAHTHGDCGIDGCTQIGAHSHRGNSGGHHQPSRHGGCHH